MRILLALLLLGAALTLRAEQPAKLFAIRFTKGAAWVAEKSPNEQPGMAEHGANLRRLRQAGLIVFGARYGDTGLVVIRAADENEARSHLASDPTLASGVFQAAIDPFLPFFHGSTNAPNTPEVAHLRKFLDAINRLDAAAAVEMCAEDFVWFDVKGGELIATTDGRAKLRNWLDGYFESIPTARTELLSVDQAGAFLTVRERAIWKNADGKQLSQQAVAVYEISDGLIRRVWYYPAVRDAPATR